MNKQKNIFTIHTRKKKRKKKSILPIVLEMLTTMNNLPILLEMLLADWDWYNLALCFLLAKWALHIWVICQLLVKAFAFFKHICLWRCKHYIVV